MSTMKGAHSKLKLLGISDESFKRKFTTERYDIIKLEEAAVLLNMDSCIDMTRAKANCGIAHSLGILLLNSNYFVIHF